MYSLEDSWRVEAPCVITRKIGASGVCLKYLDLATHKSRAFRLAIAKPKVANMNPATPNPP